MIKNKSAKHTEIVANFEVLKARWEPEIPVGIKCTLCWDEGFVEFKDYDEEIEEWITGQLSRPECEEDE